jgi:glycosyltransferase involved in cell wall biosynthesis
MENVISSYLSERWHFVPFTTSRPIKKNVADNCGYAAVLNAGMKRLVTGGLITLWHMISFPFAVVAGRIDLVQVQASAYMPFWESAFYVVVARLLGRPTLMRLGGITDTFYEEASPFVRRLIVRVLMLPTGLIVQSEYWLSFVRQLGRSDNVFILNNFVDDTAVAATSPRSPAVPIFLFAAGSEAKRKGADELMEAIALLRRDDVSARFRIVAASPSLKETVVRLGLEDIVEMEGYRSREQMMAEYRSCDVFLLPTRAEGFPNALLEAMAAGLPVIVTPVGAIPEIVTDGEGALYVPVDDPQQLKARIAALASDPILRAEFGAANRRRVAENFTARTVLPRLEAAYHAVLGIVPSGRMGAHEMGGARKSAVLKSTRS